ncbi:MAG: hypothetical protein HFE82_09925 [Erysipelotrichaceae bacterium]|nr:hypothetical protein [Erysipelotrichaceae bacterium]
MNKQITDREMAELMEEYNKLVLKMKMQPYETFFLGKWWYFFAFIFCLFGAIAYLSTGDLFSVIYLSFLSGMNFVAYLVKCDE